MASRALVKPKRSGEGLGLGQMKFRLEILESGALSPLTNTKLGEREKD